MGCIDDLKEKFEEYEKAINECLPKVDKKLITELLVLMKKDPAPMYTLEVFLKTNKNLERIKDELARKTGVAASFLENGTHMVAAHRITIQMLEEISQQDDVEEIKGTHIPRGTASMGAAFRRTRDEEYWEGQREEH
jgi:hypothetical protein